MQQIFQCPRCGAQNYQGQQACWNCGMQFVQQQPGWQQPMQQPHQQQYQQPYQQQMPPQQPYQQPMQQPGMHYQQQYGYQWQTPQKKSSSTGIILLTVLIVVLFAVGAVGILSKGTFFIPSRSEPPASTPVAGTEEPSEETEEEEEEETPEDTMIQVDASSLISEYMQDTESADATYKGKQIEVTGLVEYIGVEGEEEAEIPYVYLGGNSQSELFLVKCYFTADEKSVVDALEILASITIQGTCDGYEDDVIVKDCSIQ
jgi:hypothetical protein